MNELSAPAVEALRRAQEQIIEHCLDRISAAHPWYRTLPEASRAQIENVARIGVTMFVDAIDSPDDSLPPGKIFSVAPPALTGTITLEQTLSLVRTVLDVVVEEAPQAVPESDHDALTILVLTFGRDVGFAAAELYARAAEARGAWDARLESVAVDAMLHGTPEESASRAGSAGWSGSGPVVAVAARARLDAIAASRLRHDCRRLAHDCLVSVRGDSVIVVLGARDSEGSSPTPSQAIDAAAREVAGALEGAAVIGPVVQGVSQAGYSLHSALAGLRALAGWEQAPCPVRADELLPERLLAGDELALGRAQSLVLAPLREMGEPFEETVATYLALGRSLEATARDLFVHANTVRYRLGRVSEQTGWDPTDARDALVLHLAIIAGRLAQGGAL